jgi:hypothetical protein
VRLRRARRQGLQRRADCSGDDERLSGGSWHPATIARDPPDRQQPGTDFGRRVLACTDNTVFDVDRFSNDVAPKRRFDVATITVRNNFRLFQGPLLAYDEERFSGLRVDSAGADATERYACIRHRMTTVHLRCPNTSEEPFWCAPGENDLDNFVGVLMWQLLAQRDYMPRKIVSDRLATQSCSECKTLFDQLRAPLTQWTDRLL